MNYKPNTKLLILVFLGLIIIQAVSSMQIKSMTVDEINYPPAGYSYLKTGDFRLNQIHPPLSKLLEAVPLLFLDLNIPTDHPSWNSSDTWEFGFQFFERYNDNPDQILFWARMSIVLVSVLLALYVFKWARDLYGEKAGLFALFLYTFSPNILAHSRLATTDLVSTCFIFIAIYYFWRFVDNPTKNHLALAGITFGLAQLSKFTAILLAPIYIIIALVVVFSKQDLKTSAKIPFMNRLSGGGSKRLYLLSISLLIIFFIGLFIINLGYGFERSFTPFGEYNFKTQTLSKISDNDLTARIPAPVPYHYLKGFELSRGLTKYGAHVFLMSEHSIEGWWYYFIIAFLIKTPIPTVISIFICLIFFKRIRKKGWEECFLIIPIAFIFFAFSFLSHINLGLRYILPIYPFIFVFVSKIVNLKFRRQGLFSLGFVLLCLWYLISSVSIYPHYLAYFNEFIGGPENGHKYLIDSNLDWGQDKKLIKEYIDNSEKPIKINPLCRLTTAGKIAVNANKLQGRGANQLEHPNCYEWLRNFEPIDYVGYSWLIFDIKREMIEEYFKSRVDVSKGGWMVVGPFDNKYRRGFNREYPPEKEIIVNKSYQGKNAEVNWEEYNGYWSRDLFALDFETLFEPNEYTCLYALTYVYSPNGRTAQLRFGSDDTITAWFNDEKVVSEEVYRGIEIDDDIVTVDLLEGYNKIMIKVCNGGGGGALLFRITDVEGTPLSNLTYDAYDDKTEGILRERKKETETSGLNFISRPDVFKGGWLIIGPFDNRNKKGFKEEYPPEKEVVINKTYAGKNIKVRWEEYPLKREAIVNKTYHGENMAVNWEEYNGYWSRDLFALDFETLFEPNEYTCLYALTYVYSPNGRTAQLRFGSDDTITAWFNDEKVVSEEVYRGIEIDDDIVTVDLLEGYNKIMIKVCNGGGGGALLFRITDVEGTPLSNLTYTTKPYETG